MPHGGREYPNHPTHAMKKPLTIVTLFAALILVAFAAAPNMAQLADRFRAKYPTVTDATEPAIAVYARALVESPSSTGTLQVIDRNTNLVRDAIGADLPSEFFHVTATMVSTAAATAVELLPASRVPATRKVFLSGYIVTVTGATDWTTTATVKIQDTNGTPVDFVTIVGTELDNAEIHYPGVTGDTSENAYKLGTGGTLGKGLQVLGNANAGAGSDIKITAWGVIK